MMDMDLKVFSLLFGYLGRSDVMRLRLVSRAIKKAVSESDRILVALRICGIVVTLTFGDEDLSIEVNGGRESDFWLGFLHKIEWCSDFCCETEESDEDEAMAMNDYGAEIILDVWDMLDRVKPRRFTDFNIHWEIPFGWPRLEEFISLINASTCACTVEMTIIGDNRRPTFDSGLTFGPKFLELTVTNFGRACDFFNVAQLDSGCRVEKVTFIEMFESTLEAIDRFLKPAKSVFDLKLISICLEMSGKQPTRLFENVDWLSLNAAHFHTSTVKKYGTCPVYRLSLQGSFPFQQMYDFPCLHDLEIQTSGPEDAIKFKHLLKGIHRLDILTTSPQGIPIPKAFKQSQICHVELVMLKLTDAVKQAHPRFFAPVKQLKHLTDFCLLLNFKATDPGPILRVGNSYHSLILEFIEELIKASNRIANIKVGIQSNSQVDQCTFHNCDQTLVFNSLKIAKLKSLYK